MFLPVPSALLWSVSTLVDFYLLISVLMMMPSVAGYRPAAVLLHTAETDAALIDVADDLGVACMQLPAPAVLRQSVRSVWDLGK